MSRNSSYLHRVLHDKSAETLIEAEYTFLSSYGFNTVPDASVRTSYWQHRAT